MIKISTKRSIKIRSSLDDGAGTVFGLVDFLAMLVDFVQSCLQRLDLIKISTRLDRERAFPE